MLLNHQTRIAPTTTTHKAFVQDERAHWQARGAGLRVRLKTRDSGCSSLSSAFHAVRHRAFTSASFAKLKAI
jgi:hypothetical protein